MKSVEVYVALDVGGFPVTWDSSTPQHDTLEGILDLIYWPVTPKGIKSLRQYLAIKGGKGVKMRLTLERVSKS